MVYFAPINSKFSVREAGKATKITTSCQRHVYHNVRKQLNFATSLAEDTRKEAYSYPKSQCRISAEYIFSD